MDGLNIGENLGSPVSVEYYDEAPFRFNGEIDNVHVTYLEPQSASKTRVITGEEDAKKPEAIVNAAL